MAKSTISFAMMSAFWTQTLSMKQIQDGLAGIVACPSFERASPLFQHSHKGFVKAVPNMGQKAQITLRWFLGFPHSYAPKNDKSNKTMSSFSSYAIVFSH